MGRPVVGYYNKAGQRVPSVTEILGKFKNPDPLVSWAFKLGKEAGIAVAQGRPAPRSAHEVKTQAGQAGNIAHDALEQHIKGLPYVYEGAKLPEGVMQRAMKGFENGKKWIAGSCIKVVDTEVSLVSEKYQFGGTRDARGVTPDGLNRLLDWKTSSRVYQDYLIQLGAYSLLSEECEGIQYDGGYDILRFDKEYADFQHHHFSDLTDAKNAFILMTQLYPLVCKLEDRV
jgi:hypothetical protein